MTTCDVLDYLIVGGGPAGLQAGHFFKSSGRNYVILEAAERAGAFFVEYPRHRTLLSINKLHNLYAELDYNLRHDWNSLLSEDSSLLFRHYSTELFPSADDLARYFSDFATRLGLNIEFGARVRSISHSPNVGFAVRTETGAVYRARTVLLATGAVGEKLPQDVDGLEFATTYATHDLDPKCYEGKRVAIVGKGNSAFEVANHLAGSAAIIHILVGDAGVRHAWQTHFVGDLRAVNNDILDMYQLKSLHATLGFRLLRIERGEAGSLRLTLEEDTPNWRDPSTYRIVMQYDHVIVCTGWRYWDPSLFDSRCVPQPDAGKKYPLLSSTWESTVPGIYYAGAAMAGIDRKAASGFIHGFRYNVRSLFHLLEEKNFGVPLPSTNFVLRDEDDLDRLVRHLISRVSTSSGLYQLNGFLCDALTVTGDAARYVFELPIGHAAEREDLTAGTLFVVSLEYGFHRYADVPSSLDFIHPSDPEEPHCAAFIHPVIRCYRGSELMEEYHLGESLVVRYDNHFGPDTFCDSFSQCFAEMNVAKVKNLLNRHLRLTPTNFDEKPPVADAVVFWPWPEERRRAHVERLQAEQERRASSPCGPLAGRGGAS